MKPPAQQTPPSTSEFWGLVRLFSAIQLKKADQVIAGFLLGTLILVLFAFAYPERSPNEAVALVTAEVCLALLISLQTLLQRALEYLQRDRIFDCLRLTVRRSEAWFAAQAAVSTAGAIATSLPLLVLGAFFEPVFVKVLALPMFWYLYLITAVGLTALGLQLAAITLLARSSQIVFAILFYPLAVPLFLSLTQGTLSLFSDPETAGLWLTLAGVFATIYLAVGVSLFGEFVGVRTTKKLET